MKKKLTTCVLVLMAISLSLAHEFWLQPKKFRYKLNEEMKVDFMVGEDFAGEFWDLSKHKVEKMEMHSGASVKSLAKDVKDTKGNNLSYVFDKEGTHLLTLQSNAAFIELDAEKFNTYLKEDGIEDILDERTNSGSLDKPSREYYTRFAKLLVQAGARTDETYKRRAGFRYEIVPLSNPYMLKSGDYLECRVLWEGKPAPHRMVMVWNHIGNRVFRQNIYTENDGTIKFPLSSTGPWMISAVKMVHSQRDDADYESFWASLVFGIENYPDK